MSKIQNLKAIHNRRRNRSEPSGCFRCQRYKIWKQFTTGWNAVLLGVSLFQMSKIQNLKAIHNCHAPYLRRTRVVSDVKDTKFESNSQLDNDFYSHKNCCFRCQRYKIWKQFTTSISFGRCGFRLFQMSKIQNLKAIHNKSVQYYSRKHVVSDVKDTKFESNSQHAADKFPNLPPWPIRGGLWVQKQRTPTSKNSSRFWKAAATYSRTRGVHYHRRGWA